MYYYFPPLEVNLNKLIVIQIEEDHHVKDLAVEAVEEALVDVTMDEEEAVAEACHFVSVQARRDDRHQSVIGEVH